MIGEFRTRFFLALISVLNVLPKAAVKLAGE